MGTGAGRERDESPGAGSSFRGRPGRLFAVVHLRYVDADRLERAAGKPGPVLPTKDRQ